MFKKIIFSFIAVLLLVNIVFAQQLVATKNSASPTFYIAVLSIIAVLGLVIFFIRKLNHNLNQILKSIGISLLITLGIEILFFLIGTFLGIFRVICKVGGHCPSQLEVFLRVYLPYTAIIIFLVTILIYYIIKFVRNK